MATPPPQIPNQYNDAVPAAPTGKKNVKWLQDNGDPNNISASFDLPKVNASIIGTNVIPTFSDTTPAAAGGYVNGTWQTDGAGHISVSVPDSGGTSLWTFAADPQGGGINDLYPTTIAARVLVGLVSSDISDSGVLIANNAVYVVSAISDAHVGALVYNAGVPEIQLASGKSGSGTYIPLALNTGGSDRVVIDSSGHVSIVDASYGTFTVNSDTISSGAAYWDVAHARIGVTFTNASGTEQGLLVEVINSATVGVGAHGGNNAICVLAQDQTPNIITNLGGVVGVFSIAGIKSGSTYSQSFAGYFEADLASGAATGNNSLVGIEIGLVDFNAGNDVFSLVGYNAKIGMQIVAGESGSLSPSTVALVIESGFGAQYFHRGIVAWQNALGTGSHDGFLELITADTVGVFRVDYNGLLSVGTLDYDDTNQIFMQVVKSNSGGSEILTRNSNTGTTSFAAFVARSGTSGNSNDITIGVTSSGFTTAGGLGPSTGFIVTGANANAGLTLQTAAGTIQFQPAGTTTLVTIANGTNIVTAEFDHNADTIVKAANTTSGTGSRVFYSAVSDASSGTLSLGATSTGYTTAGGIAAKTGFLATSSGLSGGLVIQTGAGSLKFQVGGTTTNVTFTTAGEIQPTVAVAAQYGGTGQASYTAGDLLYASGTTTLSKLAIGSSTFVLTVVGGVPAWAAASSGSSNWTRAADGGNFDLYSSSATTDRVLTGITSSDLTDTGVFISRGYLYTVSAATNATVGALGYDAGSTTIQLASGKTGSGTYRALAFLTSGSEAARIDTGGALCVGTTANGGFKVNISGTCGATTFSGSGASLTSLNASNISSGTLSNSRLPSAIIVTSLAGDGSSITNINAGNIASGTLSSSRLPSSVALYGGSPGSGNIAFNSLNGILYAGVTGFLCASGEAQAYEGGTQVAGFSVANGAKLYISGGYRQLTTTNTGNIVYYN